MSASSQTEHSGTVISSLIRRLRRRSAPNIFNMRRRRIFITASRISAESVKLSASRIFFQRIFGADTNKNIVCQQVILLRVYSDIRVN